MDTDGTPAPEALLREKFDAALLTRPPLRPAAVVVADSRRKWQRRRRRNLAFAAGSLCLLVAAGGAAWAFSFHPSEPGRGSSVEAAAIPDGWQTIHWNDTVFAVPGTWIAGAPSQWCVSGPGPEVGRYTVPNDGGSTSVNCVNPQNAAGASVVPTADVPVRVGTTPVPVQSVGGESGIYPAGSWVATRPIDDHWTLLVIAPDEATTAGIVSSLNGP